jgi:ribonuclease HI
MKCKNCGTPLIEKQTKRTAEQLKKQYYFTAYYSCPKCGRMYHDEKFKVVNENSDLFTSGPHSPAGFTTADVNIWTDGACRANGTDRARAAWAFVSGDHENAGIVEGKQTNNTAEAYGIYHALLWAVKQGHKRIQVHTDSQISIQSLLKHHTKVKANQEIFKKIADVIQENSLEVSYTKVPGHADDINNNRADKLANTLAGIPT